MHDLPLNFRPRLLSAILSVGAAFVLAGCARFEHQTSDSEPHAVVAVAERSDLDSDAFVVKKLDGLPVKAGDSYRVKPGPHEVTVRLVDRTMESSEPISIFKSKSAAQEQPVTVQKSADGKAEVSGQQPYSGMQPVRLNQEERSVNNYTSSFIAKPGWHYLLRGNAIDETPAPR